MRWVVPQGTAGVAEVLAHAAHSRTEFFVPSMHYEFLGNVMTQHKPLYPPMIRYKIGITWRWCANNKFMSMLLLRTSTLWLVWLVCN